MGRWTWPAYVGVLGGLVLFLALLVPVLVIQYRRYGGTNRWRTLGAAACSIWVVALVAYTFLPVPANPTDWCETNAITEAQLRPFQFVDDIRRDTAGLPLRDALLHFTTLQVVFNVVLFVPLGAFLRRYFSRGLAFTVLAGLALSLAIETTQYTGIWGLFPCAYRYADTGDLVANTTGALLGGLAAWLLLGWMPQSDRLSRARLEARPVTRRRRWMGMTLDLGLYLVVGIATATGIRLVGKLAGAELPTSTTAGELAATYLVPALVVFYGPALWGSGASLGQRVVWLAPDWSGAHPLGRRLLRASSTGGLVTAGLLVGSLGPDAPGLVGLVLAALGVVAAYLAVLLSERGLSGTISGAAMVDPRLEADEG